MAPVHYANGDTGTLVNSGTSEDLLDVYASSPDLAVATGRDIVLLWNGNSWSPIESTDTGTLYTGTWISPEEDIVLYGILAQFSVVCPYDPVAMEQPASCRSFVSPMLTACGQSGDIKLMTSVGDVFRVDNNLVDIFGIEPIHDQSPGLFLTGLFVPPGACMPGPAPPLEMFAINEGTDIMHFDGTT